MWILLSMLTYSVLFSYFGEASLKSRMYRFRCDDNQIIKSELICNGRPDCRDSSDETSKVCDKFTCDVGYVKCNYGACVRELRDCFNEQESHNLRKCCKIDNIPRNAFIWRIGNFRQQLGINDIVENFSQIDYTCIENHYIVGNATNFCDNCEWVNALPECVPRCNPSVISSVTFSANCLANINGQETSVCCAEPAVPGTIAKINCKWGYARSTAQIQISRCSNDGRWYPLPSQCSQSICGEEAAEGTSFIVGGVKTDIKKVPWHVGIYKKVPRKGAANICGGTIVSAKVVVSAAHCFWNLVENKLNPESEYLVVTGKQYRDLHDPRENNSYQSLRVEKIHVVTGYIDYEGLFANDIAVVILYDYIEFKVNVAPVCIEEYKFDDKIVQPDSIGTVAGWGLVKNSGSPSEALKQIDLPVIPREQCVKALDPNFAPFFTSDKFCAGYLTGFGVCNGDSGGGLVFPKVVNGKKVYFLRGIVSTGQNKGGSCDNDKYSLFTNTAHFWELIQHHLIANQPTIEESSIPPILLTSDSLITEPSIVPVSNSKIQCVPIKENRFSLSECFTNGSETLCSETIDLGSSVTTICDEGYESRSATVHTCEANGEWWPSVNKCSPNCGRMPSAPYVPWLASLYVPVDDNLPFLGTGVIVSERIVLTHAEESYDLFTREILTLEMYVAVLHYFDDGNTDNQQFRRVAKRFLHQNPSDPSDRTFAVLITAKPFDFNLNYVGAVCLDFSPIDDHGEMGSVAAYGANEGRILQISYEILDNLECKSNDTKINKELTRGKMCALSPVISDENCAMVEGSGLVTSKINNGETVFYLRGIAIKGSRKPQYERCVEDEYQLFININHFKEHIQHYIMQYGDASGQLVESTGESCTISSVPAGGSASIFENGFVNLSVGNQVRNMGFIEYSCEDGYRLVGSNINICRNGVWNKTVPRCEMICPDQLHPTNGFAIRTETKYGLTYLLGCDRGFYLPPNYSNESVCHNGKWVPEIPEECIIGNPCGPIIGNSFAVSQCVSNGSMKPCNETQDPGSIVTTTCNFGFETRLPIVHTCQPTGEWWPPVNECQPICGRTPSLPHVPWLVTIYLSTDDYLPFIGSGVIVSQRIVLTYAEESDDLFRRDISKLQVYAAVLNYFDDEHTDNQQFRRVAKRFLHQNPLESSDRTLAVLVMNEPFGFNVNFVAPVCLDFSTSYSQPNNGAPLGETGSVAAYGFSKGHILQDSYKILENSECRSSDTNIDKELRRGKICARRPVITDGNCAMIEGTGLVISKIEEGKQVSYLRGIAMKAFQRPNSDGCADDEFQLFINVNYFQETIKKYITEYN